jgi:hypothetical protein
LTVESEALNGQPKYRNVNYQTKGDSTLGETDNASAKRRTAIPSCIEHPGVGSAARKGRTIGHLPDLLIDKDSSGAVAAARALHF